jgi:hypothetical protein
MSELSVGQLRGLTVNDNVITVPSGHSLYAPGHVVQVVGATRTSVFSASVAGAGVYSTDAFTIEITPSSASSKILISGLINFTSAQGSSVALAALFRNGTIVLQGDAVGSRTRTLMGRVTTADPVSVTPVGFAILDSPNTTSAVTYSIRLTSDGPATVYLNRSQQDTDANWASRSASSMVAQEIAQ